MNGALRWLAALVVCTLPQFTLPDPLCPHARGIGLGGMLDIFDDLSRPAFSEPVKKPLFSKLVGSGWPFVSVKFDHPIQSPVDLLTSRAVTVKLPVLNIVEPVQPGVKAKVYNSGHTVYVYIKEDPSLRPHLIGGPLKEKFVFEQMHFHWGSEDIWGSEHLVDGESFSVEIHMVHYNSKYVTFEKAATQPDGLAVLTIFAEGSQVDNPLLDPLYKLLPQITKPKSFKEISSKEAMQWAQSALGMNHEYYTYPGSLTTPPYSENVVFILLPKPITLSHKQLAAFRELHSEHHDKILANKREVQPLHNRPIIRSTSVV